MVGGGVGESLQMLQSPVRTPSSKVGPCRANWAACPHLFVCQLARAGEPACVWRGGTQAGGTQRGAQWAPCLVWLTGAAAEVPGGH